MMYEEYLGDGVYVGFDGYQIILSANGRAGQDGCTDIVALDSGVAQALTHYMKMLTNVGVPI